MTTTINAKSTGIGGLDVTCDASGSLGLQTGGVTALTIDTSQNVGIGTTSPSLPLDIVCASSSYGFGIRAYTGQTTSSMKFTSNNGTTSYAYMQGASTYTEIGTAQSTPLVLATNLTERMRIDSSGNVLIGQTANTYAGKVSFTHDSSVDDGLVIRDSRTTGGSTQISFIYNTTQVGRIHTTSSATTYATSSDYRLKENVVPMVGALDKVALLKPVTYSWKIDGSDGQGFIAHELQAVLPDAVVGEKDAVDADGNPQYQGIDTSFLVATLTAAIQEQQTIINDLKARIETLESK